VLKVLQLIPTLDRAGAEKQMVLLATGLPRDRFAVEVATLTRSGPLEADLQAAGVPVTAFRKRHKADPIVLGRLSRFLAERRFDVLQTWIFAANVYGRLAARRARVPVVITSEMAADVWKSRWQLAIDRRLAAGTDAVVGNSQAVVDFYRGVGIPSDRLLRIDSGIARASAVPGEAEASAVRAALGVSRQAPVVLFAGRLAPQKAVDDLLRALDLLQHVRPDVVTWIAGDGPERSRLEDLARAFRLGDRVRFLGHRDDVPSLLAAADVLVLPSRFEGLPNVVLEAMQAGKPVVATAAPGTAELVVDGETGRLVPLGDTRTLARALREVLDDRALASRLGEGGRRRVESHYDAATMIDAYASLYERLARAKGLPV
jgi:glycosyltransferase involved in cell wall biosynthesis